MLINNYLNIKKMRKIRGKKGDIPITILVIGIFAIFAFTIGSFILSDYIQNQEFDNLNYALEVNEIKEQIYFYKNLGEFNQDIANKIEQQYDNVEITLDRDNQKITIEKTVIKTSGFSWWKTQNQVMKIKHSFSL